MGSGVGAGVAVGAGVPVPPDDAEHPANRTTANNIATKEKIRFISHQPFFLVFYGFSGIFDSKTPYNAIVTHKIINDNTCYGIVIYLL